MQGSSFEIRLALWLHCEAAESSIWNKNQAYGWDSLNLV